MMCDTIILYSDIHFLLHPLPPPSLPEINEQIENKEKKRKKEKQTRNWKQNSLDWNLNIKSLDCKEIKMYVMCITSVLESNDLLTNYLNFK